MPPSPGETLVRSEISGQGAPGWVRGAIEQSPGTITFVGRGGGVNVLDERHAFDEAVGHARAQLANFVATKVTAEACLVDTSQGARFLSLNSHRAGPGEEADQSIRSRVHEIARVIVGGLAVSDQYWEQWMVSNELPEGFMANRTNRDGYIQRYKCWVLASVDSATVDAYVKTTLTAFENNQKAEEALAAAEKAEEEAKKIAEEKAKETAKERAKEKAEVALAQLKVARGDLSTAANALTAQELELQLLRERVHYGRRFRLTQAEDCLHYPGTCSFELNHPTWQAPVYLARTVLKPVYKTRTVFEEKVEEKVEEKAANLCSFCPPANCSH